jgi:hypothetical protein
MADRLSDTATAAGFGGRPDPPRMRLVAWRRVEPAGTLRGFATVRLSIGLIITDCLIHRA